MIDFKFGPPDERIWPVELGTNCGWRFLENGDLMTSYARPRQGVILVRVVGFRDIDGKRQKVEVDSWCEPMCPSCGCPCERYHASTCQYRR